MGVRILTGDCRATLATLPERSIQTCITSPPYFGLRDYGTPPLVWGGDMECTHEWGTVGRAFHPGQVPQAKWQNVSAVADGGRAGSGQLCACGAWRGSLGLETTPELFIDHLVECFREVRRVLRDDGTLWVNMGDSYSGSGKGPPGPNAKIPHELRQGFKSNGAHVNAAVYKPKDLMMMPFRVAMALQADGWYLRSVIPWLKRNSMPESVTDRPATSLEYVFLMSKSARYFWDAEAIRKASTGQKGFAANFARDTKDHVIPNQSVAQHRADRQPTSDNGTRSRRNGDWFFESWQGLMLDEQDEPLALVVNPAGFSGAHFATFPTKLVEPMVKASTSEKGQCPECGAPWVRVTKPTPAYQAKLERGRQSEAWKTARRADAINVGVAFGDKAEGGSAEYVTTGWRPSCTHKADPVPQTVLDLFGGAGTVGLVADRLGRDAVLCELKDEYADMAEQRIEQAESNQPKPMKTSRNVIDMPGTDNVTPIRRDGWKQQRFGF